MVSALPQRSEIIKRSKQARLERRLVRSLLWLAILALVLAELSWFAHRESFLLERVEITGATPGLTARLQTTIGAELAGSYLGLVPRSSIWFYPKQFLLQTLATKLPEISEIRISQEAGRVLLVSVKERVASYLWCGHDGVTCYTLDETGFAFALSPRFSGHPFFEFYSELPAIPIGSRPLSPEIFQQVVALRRGLDGVLANSVLALRNYSVSLDQTSELMLEWHFSLRDPTSEESASAGVTLLVDAHQPLNSLLTNFHSALAAPAFIAEYQDKLKSGQTLDYLDLRFPDKVFYKFK